MNLPIHGSVGRIGTRRPAELYTFITHGRRFRLAIQQSMIYPERAAINWEYGYCYFQSLIGNLDNLGEIEELLMRSLCVLRNASMVVGDF